MEVLVRQLKRNQDAYEVEKTRLEKEKAERDRLMALKAQFCASKK